MKPSLLPAVVFVTVLSGCTGGNSTPAPTAPSQQSGATMQPTPPVQPTSGLGVALTVVSSDTVDQPTIFVAWSSSSANAVLDFGDGEQVTFDLEGSATLRHVYSRSGTFVATFTASNGAGESASLPTTLVVR